MTRKPYASAPSAVFPFLLIPGPAKALPTKLLMTHRTSIMLVSYIKIVSQKPITVNQIFRLFDSAHIVQRDQLPFPLGILKNIDGTVVIDHRTFDYGCAQNIL